MNVNSSKWLHEGVTKLFLVALSSLLAFIPERATADSGGPYAGVTDLGKMKPEYPGNFSIPKESNPLQFYLTHIPRLNNPDSDPTTYQWMEITEHHASMSNLDWHADTGGRRILCIRYISKQSIKQGVDYSDACLLLALDHSSAGDSVPATFTPIFYISGGAVFNHTAQPCVKDGRNAIVITSYYTGNGGNASRIFLREDGKEGFERFTPKEAKSPRSISEPKDR